MELDTKLLTRVVAEALCEDLGSGDVTGEAVVPERATARGHMVTRARGTIAGLPVAAEVFRQVSSEIEFRPLVADGAAVKANEQIARLTGPARAVLAGERVALNFLQRLSGIATFTRRCVEAVRDYDVKILDTRKTTPGLRHLEKYAVRMGGGVNHRMGLYDQVLIKDNHLRTLMPEAGDVAAATRLAVKRARDKVGHKMLVEVETESLAMVEAALDAGADIIMLDNMSADERREAAEVVRTRRESLRAERPITEASGGVTLETLPEIVATGVDTISLGALTHSAPALDIALEFD